MEVSAKDTSRVTKVTQISPENQTLSHSDENVSKCPPVTLSWHNTVVTHKKSRRVILSNVSGVVHPGQAVALMGASGAGKTTLLNTLLNRNLSGLKIDGQVMVDGVELGPRITSVSGYVQQEELFLPTLTVKEHLLLQARLRLAGSDAAYRAKRVDEIMNDLGLMKCRNTRIGVSGIKKGISGGESKRLMFASELLNDPPLLFCDEPTTGLDSAMAESVVVTMRKLAEKGHSIICTIHQPSAYVFNLFHQVMFLAGGRLAYFGTPSLCVEMFARFGYPCRRDYNPADMLIETLAIEPYNEEKCIERITKICDQYNESDEGKKFFDDVAEVLTTENNEVEINDASGVNESNKSIKVDVSTKGRKIVAFPIQFYALLQRSVIDNWRNPALVRAKIMLKVFMGLFVGLLYLHSEREETYGIQNITGALYFLVNELTYATCMGILSFLPDDFPLVVREYHDGLYHLFSYYVARCLSYVPLFTLDGLLMMCICYYMIGLVPAAERFFSILGISLLIEQCAAAFGVMLSTCSPSYPVAIAIAAPLLTVLSLSGGMYANLSTIPKAVRWIQYISWFKYGFEAFSITQWTGVGAENVGDCIYQPLRDHPREINRTACLHVSTVLNQYSFQESNLWMDLTVLSALIFIFYAIGFIGLWIRVRFAR